MTERYRGHKAGCRIEHRSRYNCTYVSQKIYCATRQNEVLHHALSAARVRYCASPTTGVCCRKYFWRDVSFPLNIIHKLGPLFPAWPGESQGFIPTCTMDRIPYPGECIKGSSDTDAGAAQILFYFLFVLRESPGRLPAMQNLT